MRTLTDHIVEGDSVNHQIKIEVLDEPGSGGANHEYRLSIPDPKHIVEWFINFQNGPIKEYGVNGLTHEALLAIVIDRLRSFQEGPFACQANADARVHCETALSVLQRRTRERIARGIEGTHSK